MNKAIIVFYSVLGIWQLVNVFRFYQSMSKEDVDDVEEIKLSLLWPTFIFIVSYFGSLLMVGLLENPKSEDILVVLKRLVQVSQVLVILVYPFIMSGELATRALSMEITGAPSSEKRTRTLYSNLSGLMVLTFIVSSIIYIIL